MNHPDRIWDQQFLAKAMKYNTKSSVHSPRDDRNQLGLSTLHTNKYGFQHIKNRQGLLLRKNARSVCRSMENPIEYSFQCKCGRFCMKETDDRIFMKYFENSVMLATGNIIQTLDSRAWKNVTTIESVCTVHLFIGIKKRL